MTTMALRRSRTAPSSLLEEHDRKCVGLTRARTEGDIHAGASSFDRDERGDPFNLAGFFPPTSFAVERSLWTEDGGHSSFSESDSDSPRTPEDNDAIATGSALPGKVMRWLVGLLEPGSLF